MKGFVMGQGMDAVRPVGELNDSVSGGGLHEQNLDDPAAEAKLKLGGRSVGTARYKPGGRELVRRASGGHPEGIRWVSGGYKGSFQQQQRGLRQRSANAATPSRHHSLSLPQRGLPL